MSESDSLPQLPSESTESGTLILLRQIQAGTLDAKQIAVAERRQLVSFLLSDGYSTAEMGQILKVAERTIERDKKLIREGNAIARDPKLVERMMGRLVGEAELCVQRIRKAVRDKDTPCAVRVDAEHRCYQIVSDLIEKMQRLGYLPTAAQKVEAELTHHVGNAPDFAAMQTEVRRLRQVYPHTSEDDPESAKQLDLLEQQIVQADLAGRVEQMSGKIAAQEEEGRDEDVIA